MRPPLLHLAPLVVLGVVAGVLGTSLPAPPPASRDVRAEAAIAHIALGRPERATPLVEAVLAAEPGHPRASYAAGVEAHKAGRFDEAERHLKAALAAGPDDPTVRLALASTYHRAGRLALAADLYRALLARHPNDIRVLNEFAELEIARHRYAEARVMLATCLRLLPAGSSRRKLTTERLAAVDRALAAATKPRTPAGGK